MAAKITTATMAITEYCLVKYADAPCAIASAIERILGVPEASDIILKEVNAPYNIAATEAAKAKGMASSGLRFVIFTLMREIIQTFDKICNRKEVNLRPAELGRIQTFLHRPTVYYWIFSLLEGLLLRQLLILHPY